MEPKTKTETSSETREYLQSLVAKVGDHLISMYSRSNELREPGLIFPRKRDGSLRVSEQESKHLFLEYARTDKRFCYCIETPTSQTYCQKGTFARSANVDLTLMLQSGRSPVNVELKAHYCGIESIRKDLEKLIREDTAGIWFHTLERGGRLQSLFASFRAAFARLSDCLGTSHTSYLISICVLDGGLVYWRWLNLAGTPETNLAAIDSVFAASSLSSGAWEVIRCQTKYCGDQPDTAASFKTANVFFEGEGTRVNPKVTLRGKGAREGFFIHAPTIAEDTYMHLSVRGGSYRIRNFHLSGAGVSPAAFMVPGYTTLESLRSSDLIAKCLSVSAEDSRHNVIEEPGYWYERISQINQQELC